MSDINKIITGGISHAFTSATELDQGAVVKLSGDKAVEKVTGAGDFPLGIVLVGNGGKADSKEVTVAMPFSMIVKGKANGAILLGAEVSAISWTSAGGQVYETTAPGSFIIGRALTSATSGGSFYIGIFYTPQKK